MRVVASGPGCEIVVATQQTKPIAGAPSLKQWPPVTATAAEHGGPQIQGLTLRALPSLTEEFGSQQPLAAPRTHPSSTRWRVMTMLLVPRNSGTPELLNTSACLKVIPWNADKPQRMLSTSLCLVIAEDLVHKIPIVTFVLAPGSRRGPRTSSGRPRRARWLLAGRPPRAR